MRSNKAREGTGLRFDNAKTQRLRQRMREIRERQQRKGGKKETADV